MKKLFFIVLLALGINCIYAVDYEWGKPITDYYPLHELKKSENIKSFETPDRVYDIIEKQEKILDLQIPIYEVYIGGRLNGIYFSLPNEKNEDYIIQGILYVKYASDFMAKELKSADINIQKLDGYEAIRQKIPASLSAIGYVNNITPADTEEAVVSMYFYSGKTVFVTIENYLDNETLYIYYGINTSSFIE